jgi:hypothetical protein
LENALAPKSGAKKSTDFKDQRNLFPGWFFRSDRVLRGCSESLCKLLWLKVGRQCGGLAVEFWRGKFLGIAQKTSNTASALINN